ncbi:hypothetical protein BE20_19115 [Sorangium cellulosum]|uniref:Schlafen AlbA-2 domain-containing protein n=1 Tax=Sorangium cellulosum TaxID=56 RepID=A0A150SL29_SORCE|nr:hypothetical protein BE20_19115 [Sorangium cellulosum]KYF93171.1 hypothetical protein BE18_05910 [Sorangium cellulosum]
MLNKPFDQIERADIERLVADGVREGRYIDYKMELPKGSDGERKEFARDVTSFANAAGGYIIYGVTEQKEGGKNTGVPASADGLPGVNADQEILRLESMLRGNIDPVIPGVRLKHIDGLQGSIIVMSIPKSWAAPHMVAVDTDSRFYSRGSAGKQPMDVREIRSAFLLSESVGTQIRRFRDERLGRIMADETPVMLEGPRRLVLHVIPFSSVLLNAHMDLKPWEKPLPAPIGGSVTNFRHNFDGFLTWIAGRGNRQHSYLQVFRTGALEAAATLETTPPQDGLFEFYPNHIEGGILDRLPKYIAQLRSSGVEAPLIILVSLLNVKGATVHMSRRSFRGTFPVDRDTLLLPEALLEEYPEDLSQAVPKLLRPGFDALWQSCGVSQCPNYDQEGNRCD